MKNQSVSDFVAATMDAVLNSKEHKSLFATQYKKAGESMCAKHSKMDSCAADDENDARKKRDTDEDSSSAWDDNDARKKRDTDEDSSDADDNDARKKRDTDEDSSDADDDDDNDAEDPKKPVKFDPNFGGRDVGGPSVSKADDMEASAAFDVAIDSLLTASAALDSVGLGRGSALTLKIASLVVEAKKKDSKDKKDEKKKKDDKKKKDKDTQSAKDKKSNPFAKKKDDKKDDKKKPSSSKPSSSKPSSSSSSSPKKK
jgi:hypothetical protein